MVITSKENALIKHALKLQDKKYRKQFNQYIIEGERMVFDALKHGQKFCHIIMQQGKLQHYDQLLDSTNATVSVISEELAKHISQTVNNQGIFAILEMPTLNNDLTEKVLILDTIQDPGNMGTLLRTSAATNFKTVLLINCVDIYNDKVLRSTMGGIFRVNCIQIKAEDLQQLTQNNYQIFKADMKGENIFNYNQPKKPFALVIGNEGNGVSQQVSNYCTNTLSIPMLNGVESLNAGVSGSILMYELSKGEF